MARHFRGGEDINLVKHSSDDSLPECLVLVRKPNCLKIKVADQTFDFVRKRKKGTYHCTFPVNGRKMKLEFSGLLWWVLKVEECKQP